MEMEKAGIYENDLNLKATELRLGLPGTTDEHEAEQKSVSSALKSNKRSSSEMEDGGSSNNKGSDQESAPPAAK